MPWDSVAQESVVLRAFSHQPFKNRMEAFHGLWDFKECPLSKLQAIKQTLEAFLALRELFIVVFCHTREPVCSKARAFVLHEDVSCCTCKEHRRIHNTERKAPIGKINRPISY